ncbi:MAG: nucleotide pyrophosphohydrolase [Gammaproteobacteria bacterium]|jgi:NTP pyrophosphatase (non-canonical NTP hydrolase)|nr:nucleotide pyrophosphohydrolase [Gammaproteobacteria bacterium]
MAKGAAKDLDELRERLRHFAHERDWDQFHSPKNLAMALQVECAELAEHFQWLSQAESDALPENTRREVAAELADVLIYLVRLADRLGVDLLEAASAKMVRNEQRYPADRVRGSAQKYTRYRDNDAEPGGS